MRSKYVIIQRLSVGLNWKAVIQQLVLVTSFFPIVYNFLGGSKK